MEERSDSNLDFFNMIKDGKIVPSVDKVKWEFTKRYTFIALAFFTIYRIVFVIVNSHFMDVLNNFETTITDAKNYIDTIVGQSCKLSILNLSIILCNFIVVIISSLSFFNNYSIKKDYYKEIQKTIVIIEIIFLAVITFDFTIQYIDPHEKIDVDRWRLEKLIERQNKKSNIKPKKQEKQEKQIDEYVENIDNIFFIRFVVLMIANILSVIFCIVIQKNILKANGT